MKPVLLRTSKRTFFTRPTPERQLLPWHCPTWLYCTQNKLKSRRLVKLSKSTPALWRQQFDGDEHSVTQHSDRQYSQPAPESKTGTTQHSLGSEGWSRRRDAVPKAGWIRDGFNKKWHKYREIWKQRRRQKAAMEHATVQCQHVFDALHAADRQLGAKWQTLLRKSLMRLGNVSCDNRVHVFHTGDEFFASLWRDIGDAKSEVLLETYIMEPDKIALRTLAALTAAARRGVHVTVLVDAFGSANMKDQHFAALREAGGVVLTYNRLVPSKRMFFEWRTILAYRNHKKSAIVDGRIAYTGGMNVCGDHCSTQVPGGNGKFRDLHCRISTVNGTANDSHSAVAHLKDAFAYSLLDIEPEYPRAEDGDDDEDTEEDSDIESDQSLEGELAKGRSIANVTTELLQSLRTDASAHYSNSQLVGRWKQRLDDSKPVTVARVRMRSAVEDFRKWVFDERYRFSRECEQTADDLLTQTKSEKNEENSEKFESEKSESKNEKSESSVEKHIGDCSSVDSTLSGCYVQVLESYRDVKLRHIQRALRGAIDSAQHYVYVMNPYILPPPRLLHCLRRAAARGVEVRIVTCEKSDVPAVSFASRHLYRDLVSSGIRVFEYKPRVLHAKCVLIDDVFASLGSHNWDDWSHKRNLEMNIMVVDSGFSKELRQRIDEDFAQSNEIQMKCIKKRSLAQDVLYYVAYLCSRLANQIA